MEESEWEREQIVREGREIEIERKSEKVSDISEREGEITKEREEKIIERAIEKSTSESACVCVCVRSRERERERKSARAC